MSESGAAAGGVLRVAARGGAWLVVDKPPGVLSVPGKGQDKADCVAARVRAMEPGATGPLIVHRLDMDTSGLMVLGLNEATQRALSAQFEARTVSKRYVALVDGVVEQRESGVIELPLRLDPAHRPYQVVDALLGRPAVTAWRVLARETDRTRIEFDPLTGRTHQLRVHAATSAQAGGLGHAIIGDVLYGTGYRGPGEHGALGRPAPAQRLMLHASVLEFNDPESARRVRVESPASF